MPAPRLVNLKTVHRAWLITLPLAVTAVLLTVAAQVGRPVPAEKLHVAGLFFALFVAAGLTTFRLDVRRHSFVVSTSAFPLLLGLFYLPPLLLVLARTLATLLVRRHQGQTSVKLWFNTAVSGAGAALASLIVRAGGELDGLSPVTWLILVAAVTAEVLLTLSAVTGVVALVQGRASSDAMARSAYPGLVVEAVNVTIGLVVLVLLQQGPWSFLLLGALVCFFYIAYRSYARSLQQSRALNEIYELTKAVTSAPHDGTLPDVLLGRVRDLLQAEYATLWIPGRGRYPEVLLSAKEGYDALLDIAATPVALRQRAYQSGQTVAVGPRIGEQPDRRELRRAGVKDVIVVPLRAGSVVIGCLEVANRLGDTTAWGPEDARLLETIAAHAAVAVENSRLVDRLRFDAYHDALTGLPNRRRIVEALEQSVAARAPDEVIAVLLVDINGLQQVNDLLGRQAGDELLVELARRLREVAPSPALVGRPGSDEFVVTLGSSSADDALDLAVRLRGQLRRRTKVGAVTVDVDVAIGVAVCPDHGADPTVLMQRADVAMRVAKGVSSGVHLFSQALESRSVRRLGIAADLRTAVDEGQLQVYYQPKVAIADRRVVGVECLARWEHPAHGPVEPADFITLAEHTGLIHRLTEVVLDDGLRRARHWADAGQPLPVAVNVSPRSLVDPEFPGMVAALLERHGVSPESLIMEITEHGMAGNQARQLPVLRELSGLGVRLAVDDFGQGYAALALVRRLPVAEVKIDKSFVQGMATDPGDLAVVRSVVDMARHFALDVVAEGVESELTLELLSGVGCHIGQGFLFSRPLPYERLEAWFNARTESESTGAGGFRRLRVVG